MRRLTLPSVAVLAALVSALALVSGCGGDAGPEKYEVTGLVTHGDQPIKSGDIILQPQEGVTNVQTMTRAYITDGRYTAEVVGGKHAVAIRDFTGDIDMDPKGPGGGKPLFRREYHGEVDFPTLDQVDEQPVEKNIEIPATHK